MADPIATLSKEGDISIIKLDDGKANAFSYDMLSQVNELLANGLWFSNLLPSLKTCPTISLVWVYMRVNAQE